MMIKEFLFDKGIQGMLGVAFLLALTFAGWSTFKTYADDMAMFLKISMQTEDPGTAVLYYNAGKGFNEEDKSSRFISGDGRFHELSFRIPFLTTISGLRFDPPFDAPFLKTGEGIISRVELVDHDNRVLHRFSLDRLKAIHQIKDFVQEKGEIRFSIEAGANDPQINIRVEEPLRLDRGRIVRLMIIHTLIKGMVVFLCCVVLIFIWSRWRDKAIATLVMLAILAAGWVLYKEIAIAVDEMAKVPQIEMKKTADFSSVPQRTFQWQAFVKSVLTWWIGIGLLLAVGINERCAKVSSIGFSWVPYRPLTHLIYLILLGVILSTYNDYGISWDEIRQQNYGERILLFYTSGFQDLAALHYLNLAFYGGFFDTVIAIIQKLGNIADPYWLRHLFSAMFGFASVVGAGRLGHLLGGPPAKFWTVLLLSCLPLYYGHMFINTKDIPFACGYIWCLYYLIRFIRRVDGHPYRVAIKLGLVLGCTLATRIGGAIFLFYFALAGAGFLLMSLKGPLSFAHVLTRKLIPMAVAAVVAYVTMLPFWPYALLHPVTGPITAYQEMVKFKTSGSAFIAGQYVNISQPPYWYLPHLMSVQLPEVLLLLATSGLLIGVLLGLRSTCKMLSLNSMTLAVGIVVVAIAFPVAFAIIKHSTLYDNFRHFLFIVPPLVIICALTLNYVLSKVPIFFGIFIWMAVLGWTLSYLHTSYQLHPYQYVYYNSFAKGVDDPKPRYELDYWATGFKEAVAILEKHVASSTSLPKAVKVSSSEPQEVIEFYLKNSEILQFEKEREKADFHIALVREQYDENIPGNRIFAVSRFGAVFVSIYDLNASPSYHSNY
jgi:hypothetical protein